MRSVGFVASLLVLASLPLSNGAPARDLEGRASHSSATLTATTTRTTSTSLTKGPSSTLVSSSTTGSSSAAVPSESASKCALLSKRAIKKPPPKTPSPGPADQYLVAFDKTKDLTQHLADLNAFITENAGCFQVPSKVLSSTNTPSLKLYSGVFDALVVKWIIDEKSKGVGVTDVDDESFSGPDGGSGSGQSAEPSSVAASSVVPSSSAVNLKARALSRGGSNASPTPTTTRTTTSLTSTGTSSTRAGGVSSTSTSRSVPTTTSSSTQTSSSSSTVLTSSGTLTSTGPGSTLHSSGTLSSGTLSGTKPASSSATSSTVVSGTQSSSAAGPSGSAGASCAHLPRALHKPPPKPEVAVPNAYLVAFDKTKDLTKHIEALKAFIQTSASCAKVKSVIKGTTNTQLLKSYSGVFDATVVHWIEQQKGANGVTDVAPDSWSKPDAVQTQTDASWGLARISQKTKLTTLGAATTQDTDPDAILNEFPTRVISQDWTFQYDDTWGTGVTVYVVDTGVLITHSDFEGRAEKGWAIAALGGKDKGNVDTQGHGTSVASIVAGKKYGISKKATIVPIKISVNGLESETSHGDIAEGLGLALTDFQTRKAANPNAIGIINLSWTVWSKRAVEDAITAAIAEGMHFVITAGNDFENQCDQRAKDLGQFIVGGIDYEDSHAFNWGPCIHVEAPSIRINSAGITSNVDMSTGDGTSFAAPMVAGVIAAVASKGNKSPADMRALILKDYIVKPAGIKPGSDETGTPDVLLQSPLAGTGTAQ